MAKSRQIINIMDDLLDIHGDYCVCPFSTYIYRQPVSICKHHSTDGRKSSSYVDQKPSSTGASTIV